MADVFRALADPTRRAVLDSLAERDGQTLGELCAQFPAMTRFGVSKHLAVLEEADLVVPLREGRLKRHFLNAVPIEQIAGRWVSRYAGRFAAALADLEQSATRREEQL